MYTSIHRIPSQSRPPATEAKDTPNLAMFQLELEIHFGSNGLMDTSISVCQLRATDHIPSIASGYLSTSVSSCRLLHQCDMAPEDRALHVFLCVIKPLYPEGRAASRLSNIMPHVDNGVHKLGIQYSNFILLEVLRDRFVWYKGLAQDSWG